MRRWTVFAAIALVVVLAATAAAQPGAVRVIVNGKELVSDVPAQIVNDRTMIPLRAVSEAMGWKVEWDPTSKTATVADPTRLTVAEYDRLARVVYALTAGFLINTTQTKPSEAAFLLANDTVKPGVIAFMRLKPPAERVEVHGYCSSMYFNMYQMRQAMLTVMDISAHPDRYPDGVELTSRLTSEGNSFAAAGQKCSERIKRIAPSIAQVLSVTEGDIEYFVKTMATVYPEGWPK